MTAQRCNEKATSSFNLCLLRCSLCWARHDNN